MKSTIPTQNYIYLILAFCSLLVGEFYAEGFISGTLVKTSNGYVPIEQIQVNDHVICYDSKGTLWNQLITYVERKLVGKYIELSSGNECIGLSFDQKLYLAKEHRWILAQELTLEHELLSSYRNYLPIDAIRTIDQETYTYTITVADYHNFCISSLDIHCLLYTSRCV